jgi:hypothetical protein
MRKGSEKMQIKEEGNGIETIHIWNIMYGFQSRKLDMEFINRED